MKSFALPAASLLFIVVISMQLENGSAAGKVTTPTSPTTPPTSPTSPTASSKGTTAAAGKGASNAPVTKTSSNAAGGKSVTPVSVSTKPPTTKAPSYVSKLTKGCEASAKNDCFKKALTSVSCKDVKAQEKCLTKDHTVCKAKDFDVIKHATCFCPRTVASALMIAVLSAFAKMLGQ